MSESVVYREPTDNEVADILRAAQSVAVIGISVRPDRASHQVAAYLIEQTHFDVYLVNPTVHEDILGHKVYASVADLPVKPDIIDLFRSADAMPDEFAHQFPAIADNADGRTWWMQLGIRNDAVAAEALGHGMQVVMDRCIKVDYQNLLTP